MKLKFLIAAIVCLLVYHLHAEAVDTYAQGCSGSANLGVSLKSNQCKAIVSELYSPEFRKKAAIATGASLQAIEGSKIELTFTNESSFPAKGLVSGADVAVTVKTSLLSELQTDLLLKKAFLYSTLRAIGISNRSSMMAVFSPAPKNESKEDKAIKHAMPELRPFTFSTVPPKGVLAFPAARGADIRYLDDAVVIYAFYVRSNQLTFVKRLVKTGEFRGVDTITLGVE